MNQYYDIGFDYHICITTELCFSMFNQNSSGFSEVIPIGESYIRYINKQRDIRQMTDLLSQEELQNIINVVSSKEVPEILSQKHLSLELAQYIVDNSAPEDYPIESYRLFSWLGEVTEDGLVDLLDQNFEQDVDYRINRKGYVSLSIECFKTLAVLVGNEEAKTSRMYFIEAEKIAKKRPPIAHYALLRVLYDVAIAKCINYAHAEYAMNQSIPYLSTLGAQSKYTIQACLVFAAQALEFVEDGSLRGLECLHIINEHFLRAYTKRKDLDHVFPTTEPLTIADLESIEFIVYKHYH